MSRSQWWIRNKVQQMAAYQGLLAAFGLVPRDRDELLDLPLQYRWEFTRRHPYYLLCWNSALNYRRNELAVGTDDSENGLAAMCLLGMIGVTGDPADPALSFNELG